MNWASTVSPTATPVELRGRLGAAGARAVVGLVVGDPAVGDRGGAGRQARVGRHRVEVGRDVVGVAAVLGDLDDGLGEVDRDDQGRALGDRAGVHRGGGDDAGVEADDLAALVDRGAAGVAGAEAYVAVDRAALGADDRVGLEGRHDALGDGQRAVALGRDVADRGVAERDDVVAGAQVVAVADRQRLGQPVEVVGRRARCRRRRR